MTLDKGILWVSAFWDSSGYAKAARNNVLSLHRLGVNIKIVSHCFEQFQTAVGSEEDRELLVSMSKKNIDYDIVISQLTPDMAVQHIECSKYNVMFFAWESSVVHPKWVNCLNKADEVWVPSEYNVSSLKSSGVTVPVFKIPHSIDSGMFDGLDHESAKKIISVPDSTFLFYSMFQWQPRKNPEILLRTYFNSFSSQDSVGLVLKTYVQNGTQQEQEDISKRIRRIKADMLMAPEWFPKVYLISSKLSDEQVAAIHTKCDCLVSMHASEGWGLCVASETNILTKDGSKIAKGILVGDDVVSKDGCSHKVLDISKRFVINGLKITPKLCEPVIVSDNHPFLVGCFSDKRFRNIRKIENIENELVWTESKYLKEHDMIAIPKLNLNKELPDSIDISKYVDNENVIVEDGWLYNKHGYSTKREFSYKHLVDKFGLTKWVFENAVKHIKNKTIPTAGSKVSRAHTMLKSISYGVPTNNKVIRHLRISDELLYLFGWYIAEGSSTDNSAIELSMHKKEYNIAIGLKEIILKYFYINESSINIFIEANKTRLKISNCVIAEFFANMFGKGARNKFIPEVLFECGVNLKSLLFGLYEGDGHDSGVSWALATVSSKLAYQTRSILMSLGILPSLKKTVRKCNSCGLGYIYSVSIGGLNYYRLVGKEPKKRAMNSYIETQNYFLVRVSCISNITYAGDMYDFTVEDESSFVGNGVLLHNCPFEAGLAGNPVIATGATGNMEYMNEENSYPIDYQLEFINGMSQFNSWYLGSGVWAAPNQVHASELMKHVFVNREEAKSKAKLLQAEIKEKYSYKSVALLMENRITEIRSFIS